MKRSRDDLLLMLARQLDEIDGVAADANRKRGMVLGMRHGVQKNASIDAVDVDVHGPSVHVTVQ